MDCERHPLALTTHRRYVTRTFSAFSAAFLVLLGLFLVRQPTLPAPWFDEGLNVSTAATFARTGLYALSDATGPRVLDPAIQTGPTVIVPLAVVFRLFGTGLLQARLVVIAFALLAVGCYWCLAQRLIGTRRAFLALLFLLVGTSEPMASLLPMSRQVLGEVPALAYLLLGVLIWLGAVERRDQRYWPLILSGLAWGIALVTKSQVLITFPVALGGMACLDRLYYRQATWRAFLVPGTVAIGCVLTWYAAQIAMVGPERFQQNAIILREGLRLHVLGIDFAHWRNAVGAIWRTGFWIWGGPALVWGVWQARHRNFTGLQHAVLLSITLTMLVWFTLLSIGWGRYLFFPAVLTPIWLAGCLGWLAKQPRMRWLPVSSAKLTATLALLFSCINAQYQIYGLLFAPDSGYQAMRSYLATQVPPHARIESWEWELSFDAPQPFHHPTTNITNAYTVFIMSRRVPPRLYDPLQANPDYILVGGFNMLTGTYTATVQQFAEQVASFGTYQLYKVHTTAVSDKSDLSVQGDPP